MLLVDREKRVRWLIPLPTHRLGEAVGPELSRLAERRRAQGDGAVLGEEVGLKGHVWSAVSDLSVFLSLDLQLKRHTHVEEELGRGAVDILVLLEVRLGESVHRVLVLEA